MRVARLSKLVFKLVYALLKPLPPAQPVNRFRGWVAGLFMKKAGKNLRIYNNVSLSNPRNISIGDNVVINPGCFLVASEAELVIGDDTLLAPRCFLETMNHRFDALDVPIRLQGHTASPIYIGKDCWLAYGVVVLPGITIGEGVVVGAYGMVNKNLDPFTINVGNPIRCVGERKKDKDSSL